jgi:O-antigen/teichoic acid export membrane protein
LSRRFGPAFATLAANVANLVFGVVTGIISARGLTPDDRGIFVALILWTALFSMFSLVGLDQAVVFRGGGSWNLAVGQARALISPTARQLVPFVLVSLIVNLFLVRHDASYLPLALLATATIPLNAVTQLSLAPLLAGSRLFPWNAIRLVPSAVYAVGATTLLVTERFSLASGIGAWVSGNVVAAAVAVCFLRVGNRSTGDVVNTVDLSALRSYGRGVTIAAVPSVLRGRIDQLVLGIVAAPSELGVYAVAVSLAAVAEVIVVTADQVLFPRFVAQPRLAARARGLAVTASACCLLLVVPAAALGAPVIRATYGPEYVDAAGPLVVLVAGVAIRLGVVILAARAKAQRRLDALIRAEVVSLWGQLGAAVAVVLGQAAAAGLMWFAVEKEGAI